jgi:acetyl esterase/lipase
MARAPTDVVASLDERYGSLVDERFDVYWPADVADQPDARLPTIVWTHGGAWIGGSKEEISGYLRLLAGAGFTVVGLRYTLAPGATYPTPVRQIMAALEVVQRDAERLHVDADRIVLAGDSAGAQMSAQVAAIATNPDYAARMDIKPTVGGDQLRGVVLCCGVFDVAKLGEHPNFVDFINAVGWAYSGVRDFRNHEPFASTITVGDHVTSDFPPAFLTVGNADPLAGQSETLAATLTAAGVPVETLFYAPDHEPALDHEYQWELDREDARVALDRIIEFVRSRTTPDRTGE